MSMRVIGSDCRDFALPYRMVGPDTFDSVGAELAIRGGDLRYLWPVAVGHDHQSWQYDCCI